MRFTIVTFLLFIGIGLQSLSAQGIYAEFGQNRIQYKQFEWNKIATENIEILFYGDEDLLAANAIKLAKNELEKLESYLAYKYGGTMQILVFNNLNDYRQSNIGYTNPQFNSGGYLLIPNDVNTIYFNGDYHYFSQQLTRCICEIMLREMVYGGSLQDRFERVKSAALPYWFTSGLSQFLSESWNANTETHLRDAMSMHGFRNFNTLSQEESALAGVSIWRYLVEKYGAASVSTILFIARYTHSAESAIYFHTKKNMADFLMDWRQFYQQDFETNLTLQLPRGKSNIPKKIASKTHTDFELSPNGHQVAIVTNDQGRYFIWQYNLTNSKVDLLYKGGLKVLNQQPDLQFPKISWNQTNGNLEALIYEKGKYELVVFKNGAVQYLEIDLNAFSGINDFVLHTDNVHIYLSAVKNAQSDLWEYNKNTHAMLAVTHDRYFDHNAVVAEDGSVIFVSNRPTQSDTFQNYTSGVFNLFKWQNGKLSAMTNFTQSVNISDPISYNAKLTGFLSDASGLQNAWVVHEDSGFKAFAQTNYQRGIIGQSLSKTGALTAEMLQLKGQYIIFTGEVPADPIAESVKTISLPWISHIQNLDSVFNTRNLKDGNFLYESDSLKRDVGDTNKSNYIFQTGFNKIDYRKTNQDSNFIKKQFTRLPFFNVLQPEFVLWQADNRVLGNYAFSNRIKHDALRNPWAMPFLKVTLSDMLKNYVIEAGIRSSLDLRILDYITRFSILKYRFDHDFAITRHMRKYEESSNRLLQNLSVQGNYTISYPFSSNARLLLNTGIRRELLSTKGSEKSILNIPDKNDIYFTGKLEYNYDNTTSLGLNRVLGLRVKIRMDAYLNVKVSNQQIQNIYLDIRHYLPIKRVFTWANRITGTYALGSSKIAYYLGGVENWTQKNQFIPQMQFLNGSEYMLQQWVCNLRGFNRGIRMGSNFVLYNSELRMPIFLVLKRKPIESEFLKNFTLTGFCDIGTAFIGKTTADAQNPFNTIYNQTPNYSISVTSRRNPWVIGVGCGVRTRVLGYFLKFDRAIGFADTKWGKPINYLSLGFDF